MSVESTPPAPASLIELIPIIIEGKNPEVVEKAFQQREIFERENASTSVFRLRPQGIALAVRGLTYDSERRSWRYTLLRDNITVETPIHLRSWSRHIGGLDGITMRSNSWADPKASTQLGVLEVSITAENLSRVSIVECDSSGAEIDRYLGVTAITSTEA